MNQNYSAISSTERLYPHIQLLKLVHRFRYSFTWLEESWCIYFYFLCRLPYCFDIFFKLRCFLVLCCNVTKSKKDKSLTVSYLNLITVQVSLQQHPGPGYLHTISSVRSEPHRMYFTNCESSLLLTSKIHILKFTWIISLYSHYYFSFLVLSILLYMLLYMLHLKLAASSSMV